MHDDTIEQAAENVYLVHGSNTNWVVLAEGDTATLVDTGYPGDRTRLLDSLKTLGFSPEAVAAVLITHAHSDHLGSAEHLSATYRTPVYLHEAEVPHARREFLQQVSLGTVLANGWRPGVLPWARHAVRSGGTSDVRMNHPEPFPGPGALDVPGRPVPVHTPGHTVGHCVYHLPEAGLLISGDALVSGHPTSRLRGPQLLPAMFHHDLAGARAALDIVEKIDADTLLPGHGPLHRGAVSDAVRHARSLVSPRVS